MPIFVRSKTISIVNLIVDIGNTIAKVALFDGETMVNVIY
ncbi:pantothenate kinase, partial [Bacteroides salyersiae]